jgi:uncharacterized membrane protein (Fun14 family)
MSERDEHSSQSAPSSLNRLFVNPPWQASSFLAVGAATLVGFAAWLNDMASPALARGGASYLAGYLIGWVARRALKVAALMVGAILALIAVLKSNGAIDLNWSVIEQNVSHSFAWLRGEIDGLKQLVTGYLPTAGAGTVGAIFGFRKK